jgi:drug/metabolite transporter (DMT)-like permease
MMVGMKSRTAIFALISAGTLWGVTVALSKVSLRWLDPSWLSVARFVIAAPVLAFFGRRGLRQALTPSVIVSGAMGFGAVILLQTAGIDHTSVSHAAIIVGAVPVIAAVISAGTGNGAAPPIAWLGYALALAGIVLVAQGHGGGATASGDALVFSSVVLSAVFIVMQPRTLQGREPASVTAVQFGAGALVSAPFALTSGLPHAPASTTPVIAFAALALGGTVLPFWLFAYGQARVTPVLAGAFVNLEPLVGALVGWVAFSDPVGPLQVLGAGIVLVGILVSLTPAETGSRLIRSGPRSRRRPPWRLASAER